MVSHRSYQRSGVKPIDASPWCTNSSRFSEVCLKASCIVSCSEFLIFPAHLLVAITGRRYSSSNIVVASTLSSLCLKLKDQRSSQVDPPCAFCMKILSKEQVDIFNQLRLESTTVIPCCGGDRCVRYAKFWGSKRNDGFQKRKSSTTTKEETF